MHEAACMLAGINPVLPIPKKAKGYLEMLLNAFEDGDLQLTNVSQARVREGGYIHYENLEIEKDELRGFARGNKIKSLFLFPVERDGGSGNAS